MTNTSKSKIPAFKSIQEEAAFWDTHDFTDYEDEFKPVQVHFAKKERPVTVRFDRQTLTQLTQTAREKGMATTTLIRMWVLERLKMAQA
ncbi:MAG: hypothetical protein UV59_C0016G0043 [Candidatus Gottesmanbacteria bacterium GW2011_GWA1_43_11]|uniref:CopG antitoxin of type II toxin-antitoxin system n=1 Tax=Candidatus Gottesmanbacteria bacterium GW2011_GWA1_43_11 TaxID=1618436 RepID=A0A0G1CFT9_9BACT|nr:MAG: hypothetical protein UV59_C0016G0043 [Candidatus Gottesmanbacteria bacterium GW2011_GWA1_43_11]